MANNWSTTTRTKHIDVRHHFVRELIEDGTVEVIFVRTDKNHADLLSNILNGLKFHKHEQAVNNRLT